MEDIWMEDEEGGRGCWRGNREDTSRGASESGLQPRREMVQCCISSSSLILFPPWPVR